MENKIKKFLELSKEFTVDSGKVYGDFYGNTGWATINDYSISVKAIENPAIQPTKLEQFTKSQEEKIEKAKRYEEYLELQSSLLEYYTALEKLK